LAPLWSLANGAGLRRAALIGTLVSCAALGVLSPWLYRNHRQFGSWTDLSSTGGINFYLGNNRDAFGDYQHPKVVMERLGPDAPYNSSHAYRLAWEDMRAHPVLAVRHAAQKVTYFLALETDGALWNLKGYRGGVPLLTTLILLALANVSYVLLVCGVALGVVIRPPDGPWSSMSYFVAVYLLLMAVVYIGDPRYHFPLIPFAALVVARVIVRDVPLLREGLRRHDAWAQRCLRRWVLASGLLVSLMVGNLWLKYLETQAI
jgi:hypothetical protein